MQEIKRNLHGARWGRFVAAAEGEFRVSNQFTEQFSVLDLARMVKQASESAGSKVQVNHIGIPRVEKEQHYNNAKNTKLRDFGLVPHFLSESLLTPLLEFVTRYKNRFARFLILPSAKWKWSQRSFLRIARLTGKCVLA